MTLRAWISIWPPGRNLRNYTQYDTEGLNLLLATRWRFEKIWHRVWIEIWPPSGVSKKLHTICHRELESIIGHLVVTWGTSLTYVALTAREPGGSFWFMHALFSHDSRATPRKFLERYSAIFVGSKLCHQLLGRFLHVQLTAHEQNVRPEKNANCKF